MSARTYASTYFGVGPANTAKNKLIQKRSGTEREGELLKQRMKRINNIYPAIYSMENLRAAEKKARKGKAKQHGVRVFDRKPEQNLLKVRELLLSKTYKTSPYTTFKVFEPKERDVYRLPYMPDRIVHHAIMNQLEPIFVSTFTSDSYSCIKKKGIHAAARRIQSALRDVSGTTYCLKLDITKFYPTVSHDILKGLLRRKFKDQDLLGLLDEIIDSAPGLPIGNYLSQYLANYYLTPFDHWIKEQKRMKYYFRYADDIVILSNNKPDLHRILAEIKEYLRINLQLQVKKNYQIFPVAARGINVVGYVFFHTHTELRPSIKRRFARAVARGKNRATIASYMGWAKHCNSKNLIKKLIYEPNQNIQRPGNNAA